MIILNPIKFFLDFTLLPIVAIFTVNGVVMGIVGYLINYCNTHSK